jgi:GTP-binding protein HflX
MNNTDKKNAIIITLNDNTSEIKQLANTLDYSITKIIVQHRANPDVNYFIGIGKLDEIIDYIDHEVTHIDIVIIDGILKPSQWFNLEQKLQIEVHDRIHIILSIFENHAQRKEAKLQVKLAQLRYERPYVRELIHRARAGEHPGFMAGGEYQVDDYYEMIKKQIKKIVANIKKIENSRSVQRKHRHKKGFYLISLAGYTNAGKSSLMNLLTDAQVKVEGKLFSTLSTTTRKLSENQKFSMVPVLLTDTVGFIDDLPSWVVDAFHATLEEIEMADMVVLVIDASEEIIEIKRKVNVSLTELRELNGTAPVIIVFNKSDLINEESMIELNQYIIKENEINSYDHIIISTKKQKNIDLLLRLIYNNLPNLIDLLVYLPTTSKAQSLVSYFYSNTDVKDVTYGKQITISLTCNSKLIPKIQNDIEKVQGRMVLQKQKNIKQK